MEILALLYASLESRIVRFFVWLDLDFYEVMLAAGALVFCYILYRLSKSQDSEFTFEDLFTHGDRVGKADLFRLTAFGAFMAHTWVIVKFAAFDKLSENELWTYALLWSGTYVVLKGFQVFTGRSFVPPPPGKETRHEGGSEG